MNLSDALESLLPVHDANALLVLAPVGRLKGRQVARATGSPSPNATRDALLRLASTRLVIAERTSTATFYSVNEDHLLWPTIELALDARNEFERRLIELHNAHAPAETSVLLCGSVARTRSTASSDVDLLVVFDDPVALEDRDAFTDRLASTVTGWTGNQAEVYDLTRAQLNDLVLAQDPLVQTWSEEALLLAGPAPALVPVAA